MLKTTEIFVEQLIIGFIFLVIVSLFLFGHPLRHFEKLSGEYGKFFFSVVLIIIAYACGIVIDRWADTILGYYLSYKRLQVAVKDYTYLDLETSEDDIFPEDEIRLRIIQEGKEVSDYHDYLRTRLRLTRAITCLLPALFMALLLINSHANPETRWIGGIITLLFYVGVLTYKIIRDNGIPRTDDELQTLCRFLSKKNPEAICAGKISLKLRGDFWTLPIYALILYTLIGCGWVYFFIDRNPGVRMYYWFFAYPFIGSIATVLVGWVWWRICQPFFNFIHLCKKLK